MEKALKTKLKWHLILSLILIIIGIIINIMYYVSFKSLMDAAINNNKIKWGESIVSITFLWILGISSFIIWIILIVLAVGINKITHGSTLLIVFSVLPLWIIILIFSIIEYKKDRSYLFDCGHSSDYNESNDEQVALKKAFLNGIISAMIMLKS